MDLTPYVEGWKRRFAEERERAERERERVLAAVRAAGPELAREFGARRVYLFGSWAWGRPHSRSDVDIAVEGVAPEKADAAWAAAERMLGSNLDRVIELRRVEELPDWVREKVRQKGLLLYADAG